MDVGDLKTLLSCLDDDIRIVSPEGTKYSGIILFQDRNGELACFLEE